MAHSGNIFANRYRIEAQLGQGNFGSVYRVHDLKAKYYQDSKKALKILTVDYVKEDDKRKADDEAQIQKELSHPNVVKFHDSFHEVGPHGTKFCLITELCEDGDLSEVIQKHVTNKRHIPENQLAEWTVQILLGLNYIHKRKILHRDIKPSNVLLRNMIVKIADFGISKVLSSTSYLATSCKGTPLYMSPEALQSKGYNTKSDIWSVGCVIYELAALKPLFPARNIMELINETKKGNVPDLDGTYSTDLREIICRCVTTRSADRPHALSLLAEVYLSKYTQSLAITASKTMETVLEQEAESLKTSNSENIGLLRNPTLKKKKAAVQEFWGVGTTTDKTSATEQGQLDTGSSVSQDLKDLIDCLQNLSTSSTPDTLSDDTADGAFTESTRKIKIQTVITEIKNNLSDAVFEKAHQYLRESRGLVKSSRAKSLTESEILAGLARIVPDEETQQMMNTLVFLEAQEERRASQFFDMNTV